MRSVLPLNKNRLFSQGAIAVAVAIAVLAAILGIKTSLEAASNSKPFSMEGFEKKKGKGGGAGGGGGDGPPIEPHERDTMEQDAPNGDWLTDPTCVYFSCPPPLWICFFHFFFFHFCLASRPEVHMGFAFHAGMLMVARNTINA